LADAAREPLLAERLLQTIADIVLDCMRDPAEVIAASHHDHYIRLAKKGAFMVRVSCSILAAQGGTAA
jgi:hypothetical protein